MTSGTLSSKEFHFSSSDGLPITCFRWDARGSSRGVLQIAHGLGEHIGRYAELIAVLQEAGVVVYGHDHRGHGRTARSPQEFGDYGEGGFDLLVEDMAELMRIAKEENPQQPFLLLGHSMGSCGATILARAQLLYRRWHPIGIGCTRRDGAPLPVRTAEIQFAQRRL